MKQIPLDIGLTPRPRLHTLVEGENGRLLTHVREALQQRQPQTVPTYVWGPGGSGKTHLLQAVMQELHEQGLSAGWLDASTPCGGYPREFDPRWSAVLLDEVELYSPEQQHTAFNWFINAMSVTTGITTIIHHTHESIPTTSNAPATSIISAVSHASEYPKASFLRFSGVRMTGASGRTSSGGSEAIRLPVTIPTTAAMAPNNAYSERSRISGAQKASNRKLSCFDAQSVMLE